MRVNDFEDDDSLEKAKVDLREQFARANLVYELVYAVADNPLQGSYQLVAGQEITDGQLDPAVREII